MGWVVFSYSMPSALPSGRRVAVWRRLHALGAVAPKKGGVYVLPAREECIEAFQWLSQEVEQARGEALLMRVEHFEGLPDAQLIALFQHARNREYQEVHKQAEKLRRAIGPGRRRRSLKVTAARDTLAKLRRSHADIARIDFFDSPERARVALTLARITQALSSDAPADADIAPAAVAAYRDRRWVTRPHPHVDRLACAWLIRRFINPHAEIRYSHTPEPEEVAFDMPEAEFQHRGNLCTFESMVSAFRFDDPALRAIAEVVHEIDLRDGRYARPEIAGVDAVLTGWLVLADAEREAHGVALFEALYVALSQATRQAAGEKPRSVARKAARRRQF